MTNDSSQLINRLIEERERLGITQKELAQAVNVAQPSIARIESKRVTPTIDTVTKIATALGCKLDITTI